MARELVTYFGSESVFFDHTTTRPGSEWSLKTQSAIETAGVALVVIGPNWLHEQDGATGLRRIDVESDWVRREILTALGRRAKGEHIVVLPVLHGGAQLPEAACFKDALSELCNYQALKLKDTQAARLYTPIFITNGVSRLHVVKTRHSVG